MFMLFFISTPVRICLLGITFTNLFIYIHYIICRFMIYEFHDHNIAVYNTHNSQCLIINLYSYNYVPF